MPWGHTSPMDQKPQFIADDLRRTRSITEVCKRDSVSRKTGDTWIARDRPSGPAGLEDRARKPGSSPHQPPQHIVDACIELRGRHPSWGAKQRLSLLHTRHPRGALPGRSTVCDLWRRHGLVPKKRHQRHLGHPGTPTTLSAAPNAVGSAACPGPCPTGAGLSCAPVPGADGDRRFRLGCQARAAPRGADAPPVCPRLLKEFGWPQRLRPANGVPFAPTTLGRLAQLSAWGVRLGSLPEGIAPGHPQPNGRHERVHRTVKAEPTRPPAHTRRAQPRTFDHCRAACNGPRPHAALDMRTPAACDAPSPRKMPTKPPPLAYPDRFAGRDVRAHGGMRWNHPWGHVSHVCTGAYVGLEDIDDGVWNVDFGPRTRGRLLERHLRSDDASGRLTRCRCL